MIGVVWLASLILVIVSFSGCATDSNSRVTPADVPISPSNQPAIDNAQSAGGYR